MAGEQQPDSTTLESLRTALWESRSPKPRARGKTMMIDFGPDEMGWTGPQGITDLLEVCAEFIDYAKIYAMNGVVMPSAFVADAVRRYREGGIKTFTGGILFEYAYLRGQTVELAAFLKALGVDGLEVSENYVTLTPDARRRQIEAFQTAGFEVTYEFGRKEPEVPMRLNDLESVVTDVLELGVPHVIVEQSEIDMLVDADPEALEKLGSQAWFPSIIIEADPYRFPEQHADLIRRLGPEVNLANIAPGQVYRLEGFRHGIGRAMGYSVLDDYQQPAE